MEILLYGIVFLYGIIFGSFLNVCIYRIPDKEGITSRSHCRKCGYPLLWYDLVPLFSYLFLRGKCRKCGTKISIQYPLVELLNGGLWLGVFSCYGFQLKSVLYCGLISILIVISVIDFRTYEIPPVLNGWIGILGIVQVIADRDNWLKYVIGFFSISIFLLILYYASKGRAIGGGDVKLMAVVGLLLGWQLALFAFVTGCLLGSVIHSIRMKVSEEGNVLAMGPYLAGGILCAIFAGNPFIQWYLMICLA
ncbi:prepilin peptidase [[Clostridium] polysaccharolyticum]|uniref:Leader peptidase (Prepilin peptidase) / N-methyltransferase n=1 Tax=[Clostridium] polysaccharolyticum TaxID=29364 RepID=A0A1H9ZSB6_9FIRM|nr:A24 family peptidase [[Clostridium] polysaccharolyticum]SES84245.1 leader peptidase (prepilin peptidase) / N-methyltransferase [[Clostridium] polysaccharolyticum]